MSVPACGSECAREGASSEVEMNPRARRNSLEGSMNPRAWRSPLEGDMNPRARRNPLEGDVSPRARRSLLEGALDWATPVGRGGHRGVGRAFCVRLSERCFILVFCRF
jgi:hypothetical protein